MNEKRVAILGGGLGSMGARMLMAAVAASGCQTSLVGMDGHDFVRKRTTRKERSEKSRIKTVWYTVDSPEVKRMSKG
ncbi:TMhelix containing protein [Vibrio phage 1.232.O._10N.261.51.E11]|nr:TMhelix containing protein [Vibrio phage 1.232.O._10N.261.51.E11]